MTRRWSASNAAAIAASTTSNAYDASIVAQTTREMAVFTASGSSSSSFRGNHDGVDTSKVRTTFFPARQDCSSRRIQPDISDEDESSQEGADENDLELGHGGGELDAVRHDEA